MAGDKWADKQSVIYEIFLRWRISKLTLPRTEQISRELGWEGDLPPPYLPA